jgi:hypothetical protein
MTSVAAIFGRFSALAAPRSPIAIHAARIPRPSRRQSRSPAAVANPRRPPRNAGNALIFTLRAHFSEYAAPDLRCKAVSRAMGIFEPVPVAWDCLLISDYGAVAKLLTSADTLSAAELTTLTDARRMLLAVCAVDQISEEYLDTLLSEAWQEQEAPLVLAARVLRRISAIDESTNRKREMSGKAG